MTKKKQDRVTRFRTWLKKGRPGLPQGYTYETFARDIGGRMTTVAGWSRGVEPRDACKALIYARFPDCPLLDGYTPYSPATPA